MHFVWKCQMRLKDSCTVTLYNAGEHHGAQKTLCGDLTSTLFPAYSTSRMIIWMDNMCFALSQYLDLLLCWFRECAWDSPKSAGTLESFYPSFIECVVCSLPTPWSLVYTSRSDRWLPQGDGILLWIPVGMDLHWAPWRFIPSTHFRDGTVTCSINGGTKINKKIKQNTGGPEYNESVQSVFWFDSWHFKKRHMSSSNGATLTVGAVWNFPSSDIQET